MFMGATIARLIPCEIRLKSNCCYNGRRRSHRVIKHGEEARNDPHWRACLNPAAEEACKRRGETVCWSTDCPGSRSISANQPTMGPSSAAWAVTRREKLYRSTSSDDGNE
ncbi:hypothetical protein [Crucivirus-482]|nr:hypothetical protein [Crucivirus-482]